MKWKRYQHLAHPETLEDVMSDSAAAVVGSLLYSTEKCSSDVRQFEGLTIESAGYLIGHPAHGLVPRTFTVAYDTAEYERIHTIADALSLYDCRYQ